VALTRHWIASPNYSSRGGSAVRLVIVHTAEGARTYQDLGAFFGSTSAGVSSHVGIDDTPGHIGEYVKRANKAWTSGETNPVAVQVELCAFAAWTPAEWKRHPAMLDNLARWISEECRHYGLPIVKLGPNEATHGGRGVCGHVDVSGPGGHWDPGSGLPWREIIEAAKNGGPVYGQAPPADVHPAPVGQRFAGGDDSMPPEYIAHTTHPDSQGSGGYFACYASGLVRRVGEDEKAWMRDNGVGIIQVDQKDPGTRLHQMDEALRGMKN